MPRKHVKPEVILADVKSGLSDEEIMQKHQIPRQTIKTALRTLIKMGAVPKSEIARRPDYFFRRVRRIGIIAMFSDDELMNRLVLKGGNALDIAYSMYSRSSIDLDFSIETAFDEKEIEMIKGKIQKCLKDTFALEGYEVFDVTFVEKPPEVSPDMADFWGGYQIEFKIIGAPAYQRLSSDVNSLRRHAKEVDPYTKKRFRIDISKFEFCAPKLEKDMDHYRIYVYSPEHIVAEKIRSICQQMPEYGRIVKSKSLSPRPKDFFDIYVTTEHFGIDVTTPENGDLIRCSFRSKRVPLELIGRIHEFREYHRQGFDAVRDTVYPLTTLHDFDFYFDYVVDQCARLKALWEV